MYKKTLKIIFSITALYLVANAINVTFFNYNKMEERAPGAPLDGYWTTDGTKGCWDNGAAIFVKDKKFHLIGGRYLESKVWREVLEVEYEQPNLRLSTRTIGSGAVQKLVLLDEGNYLTRVKVENYKNGKDLSKNNLNLEGTIFLKRCSEVTASGKFSVFLGTVSYMKPDAFELQNMNRH